MVKLTVSPEQITVLEGVIAGSNTPATMVSIIISLFNVFFTQYVVVVDGAIFMDSVVSPVDQRILACEAMVGSISNTGNIFE